MGDLDACAAAVRAMGTVFPAFKFDWLVDEIAPHLPKELDFVHEAANCERCAQTFRRWRDVAVPEVRSATTRVLVMSWEDGVRSDKRSDISALGLDLCGNQTRAS